jgi:hypothetical protein
MGRISDISRALSWLLRHSKLVVRSDGYLPVLQVLADRQIC